MPFNIQGPELIILLVIALLVLGPGKLPEVGSALGKSIREFRKAASDVKEAASVEPAKTTAAPAELPSAASASGAPSPAPEPAPAQAAAPASAPASAQPEPVAAARAASDTDSTAR